MSQNTPPPSAQQLGSLGAALKAAITDPKDPKAEAPKAPEPQVALGGTMPKDTRNIPTLQGGQVRTGAESTARSVIAEGVQFTGNALWDGMLTVSGKVTGNLSEHAQAQASVTISETGQVKGDIKANQISVLGQTEGTLDAAGGSVAIHANSSVSGHVRYGTIQVNAADLNATLERVKPGGAAKAPTPAPHDSKPEAKPQNAPGTPSA
jgi:cytoskeletal protein CcmA (bactofilin family)